MRESQPVSTRIDANTCRTPCGCLEWTGKRNHQGYGVMWVVPSTLKAIGLPPGKARWVRAHRAAWYAAHGDWPPLLMHTCDNPACVDVAHLQPGTQMENIHDAMRKRRFDKAGSAHHGAKLTEVAVRMMRRTHSFGGVTTSRLAAQFGVTPAMTRLVLRRKNWTHL